MNLINISGMQAALTTVLDAQAREHVVAVVKGTFLLPSDQGAVQLVPQDAQQPMTTADTFFGEPGMSAPRLESEFALRKARCDIVLNGHAYPPGGKPAERCTVGLRVGSWQKILNVVGDRVWRRRGVSLGPSSPEPFVQVPLTYGRAFGGVDDTDSDQAVSYARNPVGRGFGSQRSGGDLIGRAVANLEFPDDPIQVPWGSYAPASLGIVHRSWQPRLAYAGTYDQAWLDQTFPFLPADFDARHYQSAAEDQQLPFLTGATPIVLVNLTRAGRLQCSLPSDLRMPVTFFPRDGAPEETLATLDTIVLEPDDGRIQMVWRCSRRLRRDVFEMREVMTGEPSKAWRRARARGKVYYRRLGALVETEMLRRRERR